MTAPHEHATESTYVVRGMSCSHCRVAIAEHVQEVDGVQAVDVDLDSQVVTVRGTAVADAAVRAAIDQAGYEVAS